jgi:hypothetical protein
MQRSQDQIGENEDLRTVDCICIHSHMMSTIEFLTKWIKQRFLITLIEYLYCILLLNNLLTRTGSEISIEILKNKQKV